MGEIERFVNVAQAYGERLKTTNVKAETTERLLSKYPSHEFVIDREEAAKLFERIEVPPDELELLAEAMIRANHPTPDSVSSFVRYLNGPSKSSAEPDNVETNDSGERAISAPARSPRKRSRPPSPRGKGEAGDRKAANGRGEMG